MENKINILVIDSNISLTKEIEKYFSSHDVIKVVACKNDGEEGLSYILTNHNKIDLIIMDLLISKFDGLFILDELRKRNICKSVIITTNFKDDQVMEEANEYGIDYYMLKPVNLISLEKRIMSIRYHENKQKLFNQEALVSDLLHKLGIPSHIRGYQYIKKGIMMVYNNGNKISFITKDIYPEIAKEFSTTPTRVERAIRHAIEVSWSRGDINLMEEIFGNSINVNRDKPTNSEFLITVADRLRIKQNLVYS